LYIWPAYAAWETPYWEEYFERNEQIISKLESGDMPVGLANKLYIQSREKFQTDVSKAQAEAVIRRQQAAALLLQSHPVVLAPQPMLAPQPQFRTQITNCNWIGNNLNCMSF
jgi:hypothetical protein